MTGLAYDDAAFALEANPDDFRARLELRKSRRCLVLARIVGVEPLQIEILSVGARVGHAPGDVAVAARDDRRNARQSSADDVFAGKREVSEIPERRDGKAKMRIVGEQRFARHATLAADNPVVGSCRIGDAAGLA